MVPAYFRPDTVHWNGLVEAADENIPLTVIFNPNSGPIPADTETKSLPEMYKPALGGLRSKGVKVLGYIYTDPAFITLEKVKADVDYYLLDNQYGEIDGFFLDVFPQNASAENLARYKAIRQHIKNKKGSCRIVGNPGLGPDSLSKFLDPADPSVDELVSFESNVGYPEDPNAVLPWKRMHGASRFANLPWDVASANTMRSYIDLAKSRNVGHIYVTDDDGSIPNSVFKNPWDTLPAYWKAEVQRIKELNAAEIAPRITVSKTPAGQASLAISGSPGVTEIHVSDDLINWTRLTTVDMGQGGATVTDPNSTGARRRFYLPVQ